MSWYQTKPNVIEAKQLMLLNAEEIERFVGGDSGDCHSGHVVCMIFATKQGALHVRLGEYLIKNDAGEFSAMSEKDFNEKYIVLQRDPYGD